MNLEYADQMRKHIFWFSTIPILFLFIEFKAVKDLFLFEIKFLLDCVS